MKLMLRSRRVSPERAQAGDTIVEVLICIAVVSTVLVGAFLVSSRSTAAVQDSAEHTQGVQYVQGQVEALRTYLQGNTAADVSSKLPTHTTFCMDPTNTAAVIPIASPATPPVNCVLTQGGAKYNIVDTVLGNNTYDLSVNWLTVTGATAHQDFFYRAYPQS